MSECCEPPAGSKAKPAACPRCGAAGKPVASQTALAIAPARAATLCSPMTFCRTKSCPVLYFDADGQVVENTDAIVRVGLKETEGPIPLCYCFGYSRADIEAELADTGDCSIPARITAEIKAGRCACETKNPSGSCCLGEVTRAVTAARDAMGCRRRTRSDGLSPGERRAEAE